MQNMTLERDRTARVSGADHYTLKLMSLNTGKSVKELINQAVGLLIKQNPGFHQHSVKH